jgi:hypothetical protein
MEIVMINQVHLSLNNPNLQEKFASAVAQAVAGEEQGPHEHLVV